MMVPVLKTERLSVIHLLPEHAPELLKLNSEAQVLEFLGMPAWVDLSEAVDYVLNCQKNYAQFGFGQWGVVLSGTAKLIGVAGLYYAPNQKIAEVSYRFFPKYWGNGYASEVVKAIIGLGFEHFDLEQISANVRKVNLASVRVLVKSGMKLEKSKSEELMFLLQKSQWLGLKLL
jgi:ribosomal-protein-alanine N-acetyltransferase